MTAAALLSETEAAGIRLSARGDRLHVEAPRGRITPALRARLTEYKSELLALIERRPPMTDRQVEALDILKADPSLRRAFAGEPTEAGYRLAVAIRKQDGRIICGELVLPGAPPLAGLVEAFADRPTD